MSESIENKEENKENKDNKENKENNNIINKLKNYNFSTSIKPFHQLEKIVYTKFVQNYTKYFLNVKKINDENENDKVSIYDYFQGNNIIFNKKCRLKVLIQEYTKYFNLNEYIIDHFMLKECNYMLKFLLYFIYNRDNYVINEVNDKKKTKL
jgi:hypothetical protein